jgi:hypothetical protein
MSVNPPAGWYPDPSGRPGQRYYDGQRWTEHFAPPPAPYPYPAQPIVPGGCYQPYPPSPVAVAVSGGGGVNHALHAVLTFFTCGMWLPVWILCAIFGSGSSQSVAVAGNGVSVKVGNNRKPLIIAGVVLGWFLLSASVMHPWLLAIALPLVAGVGLFVYTTKQREARARRELDEQMQRDIIAGRADYENKLYYEGDPRGTYGKYMPPRPPPPVQDETGTP